MLRTTAAIVFLFATHPAASEEFPHLTCPVVRALVAEHGKAKALAGAIRYGATWQQIQQARKCLHDSRR